VTIILKQIFQLIHLLNSDKGHKSIAMGIACGFVLGMTPNLSLQSILIFICLFLFRIQIGAALLASFFFAFIAWILDPVFHSVGSSILELDSLRGFFTTLYNQPILPLTRFYNSIVMGSAVVSFLLAPVVYLVSVTSVVKYRKTVVKRFENTKFWKAVKISSFYKWYSKYEELYG